MTVPTLYLIPSNLSDAPVENVLPALNLRVVTELRYFIVENVRTARRFLKRCNRDINIDELTFFLLNVNTRPEDVPAMLQPMSEGHSMGIISEAGCPAIADPGALAVAAAHNRGYNVEPLIGPSSILLSLMASGFNGQSFAFNGYLPIDGQQRSTTLKRLYKEALNERRTQIFIETPYRNNRLIADIVSTLPPNARLCVASDLTGENQRITTLPLAEWARRKPDYYKTPAIFLIYGPQ